MISLKIKRLCARLILSVLLVLISACATQRNTNLYEQIGGHEKLARIADYFIDEIQYDKRIIVFFMDTNIDRFREKFIEHTCEHIDGPCHYSGDDMAKVHGGMNISEADFNHLVDLLINAMTRAEVPHRLQNQVLARLAPMRAEMLYR